MARRNPVAVIRVATILSSITMGCFSTEVLTGSPCGKDGSCGDELRCIKGFCQPASCEGNPDCAPYSVACAADGGGQECPKVGARGCFFADAEPDAGYCALSCDAEELGQCPAGVGGTATSTCVAADSGADGAVRFCALDCGEARTCPTNMHCVDVEVEEVARALCMFGT